MRGSYSVCTCERVLTFDGDARDTGGGVAAARDNIDDDHDGVTTGAMVSAAAGAVAMVEHERES